MVYQFRTAYLLLFLFIWSLPVRAFTDTLKVGSTHVYQSQPGFIEYIDSLDQGRLQDAIHQFELGKAKVCDESVFNPGIASKNYWFHFVLTNDGKQQRDVLIDIANPRINHLLLFEKGKALQLKGSTGDFIPFAYRPFQHKNFIFSSNFLPGETKDFYLFVNQVGHVLNLPIEIYHTDDFDRINSRNYFTDGITYGILLFMALLTLVFFISTLHTLYLYYSLYIFVSIAWLLSYFGLGFQYIWPNYPEFSTIGAPCFASLNLLLNIQICMVLLRVKENSRRLNMIGNVIKSIMFMFALFPFIINLNEHGYALNNGYLVAFLSSILLSVFYIVYIIILYASSGSFNARFYLLANVLKVPSLINLALFEFGVTPGIHNLEGFMQSGLLVEIAILTFAISKRYTLFKFRTFQRVIKAEEDQRQNFSKELHDGISNSLTSIRFQLQHMMSQVRNTGYIEEKLKEVCDNIGMVQVEARNISHNLMPNYLRTNSFIDIIRLYLQGLQLNHEASRQEGKSLPLFHFSTNKDHVQMPDDTKLHLFRVMQEVISNITKHSKATEVDIVITVKKSEMIIVVSDNGIGLNVEEKKNGKGNGLSNIFSRIQLINGKVEFMDTITPSAMAAGEYDDETLNKGTTVVIRVPLKRILHPKFHMYDY